MQQEKQKLLDYWTHPSVKMLARGGDPVEIITDKAKEVVFSAMQKGWSGPPFDPFQLADILNIGLTPNDDVMDAKTLISANKFFIEFNPNRPQSRTKFSVAHEIAHTIFEDCKEMVRERKSKVDMRSDEWQLETLCNIAASEFLMPVGSFKDLRDQPLNIDTLLTLKERYEVSTEALLLRTTKLTKEPCFAFFSSRMPSSAVYCVDYSIRSSSSKEILLPGVKLAKSSCINECIAIGYTSKGDERLPGFSEPHHIESVGIPAHPSQLYPRVASIARPAVTVPSSTRSINYLKGDATKPRGRGHKIIAFIVNDKALSWGKGFGLVMQNTWPFIQQEFRQWIVQNRKRQSLGNVHISRIDDNLTAFKMIAQHGFGLSPGPRIRYTALEMCLRKLADTAKDLDASVHMPRIGVGYAGGTWDIVSEIIEDTLCRNDVAVTIYDLPSRKNDLPQNGFLFDL